MGVLRGIGMFSGAQTARENQKQPTPPAQRSRAPLSARAAKPPAGTSNARFGRRAMAEQAVQDVQKLVQQNLPSTPDEVATLNAQLEAATAGHRQISQEKEQLEAQADRLAREVSRLHQQLQTLALGGRRQLQPPTNAGSGGKGGSGVQADVEQSPDDLIRVLCAQTGIGEKLLMPALNKQVATLQRNARMVELQTRMRENNPENMQKGSVEQRALEVLQLIRRKVHCKGRHTDRSFRLFDMDGSGELDHEEFRRALTYMGVSLPVRYFLIFRWSSAGPPKN
eukprot:SAG31_NODE_2036_length_6607_cov_5.713430_4_plen_282_part_00